MTDLDSDLEDPVDEMSSLINGIVDDLSAGSYENGAKGLQELARSWARAGLPLNSFLNMRKHIIDTALQNTGELFLVERLTIAERELQHERKKASIFH